MKKKPPVLNAYLVYSPKNEVRSLNKVFKKFCKDTYHYAENHWLVNSSLNLREFCDEIYKVKKQRVLVLEIKEYTGCNHGDFWGKSFPILVQVRLREQSESSVQSVKSDNQ